MWGPLEKTLPCLRITCMDIMIEGGIFTLEKKMYNCNLPEAPES
jgi:hypothetical protein